MKNQAKAIEYLKSIESKVNRLAKMLDEDILATQIETESFWNISEFLGGYLLPQKERVYDIGSGLFGNSVSYIVQCVANSVEKGLFNSKHEYFQEVGYKEIKGIDETPDEHYAKLFSMQKFSFSSFFSILHDIEKEPEKNMCRLAELRKKLSLISFFPSHYDELCGRTDKSDARILFDDICEDLKFRKTFGVRPKEKVIVEYIHYTD